MKKTIFLLLICSFPLMMMAQQKQTRANVNKNEAPKLVVGLVIDQMRWDYLVKFRPYFQQGGFKRLLNEGYNCDNTMITHTPTYTAVGHAGIYTGSFPSIHGIVGNNWTDRNSGKPVYCTDDSTVQGIGTDNDAGRMSPRNMLSNTIGDQLHLSNNYESKVIGIAIKDRSAILPAGHSANGAYWFDESKGNFISSTYYMNQLPEWVNDFNQLKLADRYMNEAWTLSPVLSTISTKIKDDETFEKHFPGLNKHAFPFPLDSIHSGRYKSFKFTPFANNYTFAFAKKAIVSEQLGTREVTDMLTISMSAPDYIGHNFGPNSLEIMDTYVRLDKEIASFLNFLDSIAGRDKYLLFLTADHGVANNPEFLKSHREHGGNYEIAALMTALNDSLDKQFGPSSGIKVIDIENSQVYLNHLGGNDSTFQLEEAIDYIIAVLKKKSYIMHAFRLDDKPVNFLPDRLRSAINNSYFPKRSGNIMFIPNPGWIDGGIKGSTHGLWNPYDAHIPLIWYGWNIKSGHDAAEYNMCDIAPTLAALLRIQMPNGSMGRVIERLMMNY
jgi:predicted AlkP superfamily pyrophosphatase or phosphodiesterase